MIEDDQLVGESAGEGQDLVELGVVRPDVEREVMPGKTGHAFVEALVREAPPAVAADWTPGAIAMPGSGVADAAQASAAARLHFFQNRDDPLALRRSAPATMAAQSRLSP